jgi:streptomycin 6-kinase
MTIRKDCKLMMRTIPEQFACTTREVYGQAGAAWLEGLPELLERLEQHWSLTVDPPFEGLSYNYVAPATRADGTAAVLKVGVPNPELLTEIEALRLYEGRGIARLLDAEPELGALLLERLTPGVPLATLEDDEAATAIAAGVMRQLWRPAPAAHAFPTVERWSRGLERLRASFDGGTGPFPGRLVEQAERLFSDLLGSMAEPVLLHGDLHHYNILSAEREPWLALDPKGVVGEPAYEVGAFLRNPVPQLMEIPDLGKVLARRVDQFAEELELDRARLVGWGMAQAVLSAWWTFEDHGRPGATGITVAELLADQLA